MDDWSAHIATLRSEPSLSKIADIVNAFSADLGLINQPSRPLILEYLATVLSFTVPQVFAQLSPELKHEIARSLQTISGISTLLSKLSTTDGGLDSELPALYGEVLHMVFNDDLVPRLVVLSTGVAELARIDHLIFKGGVWAQVNQARHSRPIPALESGNFKSATSFNTYLSRVLAQLLSHTDLDRATLSRFYASFMVLSREASRALFETVFTQAYWPQFIDLLETMKRYQRKDATIKLLTGFIPTILNENCPDSLQSERIQAVGNILAPLSAYIDDQVLESSLTVASKPVNLLVAYISSASLAENYGTLVKNAVASWADPYIIKSEPIPLQQNRTDLLHKLIAQPPGPSLAKELLTRPVFLTAISSRLESFSEQVKNMGIFLANRICELADQDPIFKDEQYQQSQTPVALPGLGQMAMDRCWELVKSPIVIEPELPTSLSELSLSIPKPGESADSDDEDAGTYTNGGTVPAPVYIKTLLEYLLVNVEKEQAYEMRRVALASGPTLLRQKSSFGNEVAFYGEELFTQLAGLSNHFGEKDFPERRLQCMIAVLVASPSTAVHACRLLLTGDYSLQQRMELVSAMSLAVRELRGFHDTIVSKSFTPSTFPTNELPPQLHRQLLAGNEDPAYDTAAFRGVQDTLMAEAAEEARDELSGGKILRVSRRLIPRDPSLSTTPTRPDFYKTVAAHFFFPLLSVWYEAGTIDIGHYSTVFVAHYIRTVSLIMHAAYPAAPALEDMTREYFQLVIPLMAKTSSQHVQVVESISTGVMLVCEITETEVLASRYHRELELTQQWLNQCWEELIDERVKSLCAGLMLRISQIINTFQRTISDDLNGFYS